MHFIITGATGFVGRHLLRHPEIRNCKLVASSRRIRAAGSTKVIWKTREEILSSADQHNLGTTVMHLEVKQHVPNPTELDVRDFHRVNVDGTREWLAWCAVNGVQRFVFFSSIKAVIPDSSLNRAGATMEDAVGPPDNSYGRSKWEAENAVRVWAREDASRRALILRPAVIYGPGNTANMYSFVDAIARNRFCLVGRNANVKSILSVQNLTAAVLLLVRKMQPGVAVYNITDAVSYSVRDLSTLIASLLEVRWRGWSIPLPAAICIAKLGSTISTLTHKQFPFTKQRLEALLETTNFSCSKLLESGFKHPQSTAEGLKEMIEWYRSVRNERMAP